jgi:type III secretion inner rod protein HrpB2
MIDAIEGLAKVGGTGAGSATSAVSPHDLLAASDHRPAEIGQLGERFDRLMAREPDVSVFSEQHLGGQGTPVTAFVKSQEALMQHSFDAVRQFSVDAPSMGPQELASRHIDLTYQLAMVQVQFNAGVYLAQSAKSGIQTLMKNQ